MFINDVKQKTGLTKKAIEYYCEQGLISPLVLENGYRKFNERDVEYLKKVSVLRKLGISIDDIKTVLADETGDSLQKLSIHKELNIQREQRIKALIDKLSYSKNYSEIGHELKSIEISKTITEKLLEAFPGYYGRFICMYFAQFLNEPMVTNEQQIAYKKIVSFLDDMPPLVFPQDLKEYFIKNTNWISAEKIATIIEGMKKSTENHDDFLSNNKEILEQYLEFRKSEEYLNSMAHQLKCFLKEFNNTSGYYDIFIPALKELSSSYVEYYTQMELLNDKLLSQYPEIKELDF